MSGAMYNNVKMDPNAKLHLQKSFGNSVDEQSFKISFVLIMFSGALIITNKITDWDC